MGCSRWWVVSEVVADEIVGGVPTGLEVTRCGELEPGFGFEQSSPARVDAHGSYLWLLRGEVLRTHLGFGEARLEDGALFRCLRRVAIVTARVTTLKGADAGAYYVEALPSYYLDAGEPRGIWHGRGAHQFGLVGEVGDVDFLDIMARCVSSQRGSDTRRGVRGEVGARV